MKTRMEKVGRYLKERTREWLENGFRGEKRGGQQFFRLGQTRLALQEAEQLALFVAHLRLVRDVAVHGGGQHAQGIPHHNQAVWRAQSVGRRAQHFEQPRLAEARAHLGDGGADHLAETGAGHEIDGAIGAGDARTAESDVGNLQLARRRCVPRGRRALFSVRHHPQLSLRTRERRDVSEA